MHRLLVVEVTGLHTEHLFELLGSVNRVTHPLYVANIVLITLGKFNVYTKLLVVDIIHRVANDISITIAMGIIEVEQQLLICLVILLDELSLLEEVDTSLICLLEGATQTTRLELFVALEVDLADAYALAAIDDKGQGHELRTGRVALRDAVLDFRVAEALLAPILLDELRVLDLLKEKFPNTAILPTE